jgi:hypothetical protein
MKRNKKIFSPEQKKITRLSIYWVIAFFGFGQLLFGCAGGQQQKSWQFVESARVVESVNQNGKTDRRLVELEIKKVDLRIQEAKLREPGKTMAVSTNTLPIKKTITGPDREFQDDLGEVATAPQTVVEEVDHLAQAIAGLVAISEKLAGRAGCCGSGDSGAVDKPDYIAEILTLRSREKPHKQPESELVAAIRETGKAVPMWIKDVLLGWFAFDAVKAVAAIPTHYGDTVHRSNNPSTNIIEVVPAEGAPVGE